MTEAIHGFGPARPPVPIVSRWSQAVDHYVLIAVFGLYLIGLLLGMASSPAIAERTGAGTFSHVIKQSVFGAVALLIMVAISALPVRYVRRLGFGVFAIAVIGIALLPFFGTDFGKGAVRWFALGFGSVQPSEFVKPGFIVVAAWFMSGALHRGGPPGVLISAVIATALAFALAMQPDFGQAALVLFSWVVMYYASGATVLVLAGIAALLALAGLVAYQWSEHFAGRIDAFAAGTVDPFSQLEYSISAVQKGGLFGSGVAEGSIKYLLPDAHTDFIISVGAEEYGLILVLLVVFLFAFVSVRSLWVLSNEVNSFKRLAGTGLAMLFGIQAFINIGVSIGVLPAKGLTLPFVSYGGSSVISVGIMLGILLALTRKENADVQEESGGYWSPR